MRKSSTLWLGLCLSSLVVTVSLVTPISQRSSANANQAIAQVNACASKGKNVGGPLAKQLQGKPVLVDIYATWCPACKNIAPTLSQLKQQYGRKIHVVVLDVSDKSKASQAETKARELGLTKFFAENKSQTGMVAIIDPATGNILAQHRNNANLADYTSVLNSAISQR
ncbi:MAG: thioredoxin family protein [Phormidium sp.]